MKETEKTTYSERETGYVSPLLELLSINSSGMLCQSGTTEDFNDNTTPVDWFTTDEN